MFLTVDIGATKTLLALFSGDGVIVERMKFPTAAAQDKFLAELETNLSQFSDRDLEAVVFAVPGEFRVEQKSYSIYLANRDWGWVELTDAIKNLFDCPVYFENDANLAAVYESTGLDGKTLFLTFSTGIGGGIAENGHLLPESTGFEPGHIVYKYGNEEAEWEDLAAASALERAYGVERATDLAGEEAMRDIAARIALGLPSLVEKYAPDTIIIGGPMGKLFYDFVEYLPDLGVKYLPPRQPLEAVSYGCYIFGKSQK